jgi:hypothetical protein
VSTSEEDAPQPAITVQKPLDTPKAQALH